MGISNEDNQLGGVRLSLNIRADRLFYMLNRRVLLDMGTWLQPTTSTDQLPYALLVGVVGLDPDRWLLQTQWNSYIQFDHGLEQIMGTHFLREDNHLIVPTLDTPIKDLTCRLFSRACGVMSHRRALLR